MELKEAIALKLIGEIKKPGRECIYDFTNESYKNNHIKQQVWTEISIATGINRGECQALWKALRRRHKTAVNKKSGSTRLKVKGFSDPLTSEMNYFQSFWEDKKPRVPKSEDSNADISHIDSNAEFLSSVDSRVDDEENELKERIKSLNNAASKLLQTSTEKRDPFFLALEDEFSKVPEHRKSALKVKLLALVVEHQQ